MKDKAWQILGKTIIGVYIKYAIKKSRLPKASFDRHGRKTVY